MSIKKKGIMRISMMRFNKNSGMALMVVVIILIVMSILSLTIVSQSVSQSKTSHTRMEDIVAEEVAKGAFWQVYDDANSSGFVMSTTTSSVTLNGRTYTTTISAPDASNQNKISVAVTYNAPANDGIS